jgi:hypothetical protein
MGEELRLRVFNNGVPRKISRYRRDAVTGGWIELQD